MTQINDCLQQLLFNLRKVREKADLSAEELEKRMILGPGWITQFEDGETLPSLDMLLAILHETGASFNDLLSDLPDNLEKVEVERLISAEQAEDDIVVRFSYAKFDAKYTLVDATIEQFESVMKTLRDGLARLTEADFGSSEAIKTDSVARSFLGAVELWPHANPSDLWWFVIYRAYCDPFNHPAKSARLDFNQSWKRTGGWALEEVIVRHYGPFLRTRGVNLFIADAAVKHSLVEGIKAVDRLESDKIDVVLTGGEENTFFGIVNVKASFAERRTDDVPMSAVLSKAGYTSPIWTMDCKSTPARLPVNRGELGSVRGKRSAKRKDIEDEGYFTGCFSYNTNTIASSDTLPPERRIFVCNFQNPDDAFSDFILKRWQAFQTDRREGDY